MLDERGATWRVFTTLNSFDRILTCGVDSGMARGLSRVGAVVESIFTQESKLGKPKVIEHNTQEIREHNSVSDLNGKYTIIVIGGAKNELVIINKIISMHLDPVGKVVLLNTTPSNISKQILQNTGLAILNEIVAIPQKNPRLYFPLKLKKVRGRGLSFHKPGRLINRLALSFLYLLSFFGWVRPLKKNAIIIIANKNIECLDNLTYKTWLEEQLGYPLSGLVAYAGSDSERRKITILAIAEYTKPDVVVKVSDTKGGIEAIQQESQALRSLEGNAIEDRVPKLLFEGEYKDGSWVQGQSLFDCKSGQKPFLTEDHFNFLKDLSYIMRSKLKIKYSTIWQNIDAEKKSRERIPVPIKEAHQWLIEKVQNESESVFFRTHGDFTPWNIYANKNSFFVYDWEDSIPDGLAGSDLLHFAYRQAELIGPWPGGEELFGQMYQGLNKFKNIAHLDIDSYLTISLWLLHEYLNRPSRHLVELAEILNSKNK